MSTTQEEQRQYATEAGKRLLAPKNDKRNFVEKAKDQIFKFIPWLKQPVFYSFIVHIFFAACSLTMGLWAVGFLDNIGSANTEGCNIRNIRGMLIANIVLSFVGMYTEMIFSAAYLVEAITNWNTDTSTEYKYMRIHPCSVFVTVVRIGVWIAHLVLVIVITVQAFGACKTEKPETVIYARSYAIGNFIMLALVGAGLITKIVLLVLGFILHKFDPKRYRA
jgi:hypothetical protein